MIRLNKARLFIGTIKYLKLSQLINQFKTKINKTESLYIDDSKVHFRKIIFFGRCRKFTEYLGGDSFCFLNLQNKFYFGIDWNFSDYGKLWSYNLEYFNYLHQNELSIYEKNKLLNDFYNFSISNNRSLEPYPISLRVINIIRCALSEDEFDTQILCYVRQELDFLNKHYEYHILGNHLLENAFALFLGAAFFNNKKWHDRAKSIIIKQLEEQILSDGAHFELSPMYHSIIFYRLLELIDWYSLYTDKDSVFLSFCKEKASRMRSWLENMVFADGSIPLFNDSANGIAFEPQLLIDYANQLEIQSAFLPLGESGYRSFRNDNYEIKIDFAQIGASYQPGHAHADALSFILYYKGKPLFVEQGTSTYQIGERRDLERSTQAHNTVTVGDQNQSQVWGGFRVANRARTFITKEGVDSMEAYHDGYKQFNTIHTRKFLFNDNQFTIIDYLENDINGKAFFHFHPNFDISITEDSSIIIGDDCRIVFDGDVDVKIETYRYSESYNIYIDAQRLVVNFNGRLNSTVYFI